MKSQIFLSIISLLIATFFSNLYGQVTQDNNNPINGNFVGFNGGNEDLPIRNDGDADILISTNNFQRFRISEQPLWNGLNGLQRSNVQRTTLGLQGENDLAWSILHLWDDAVNLPLPASMHRDWFNVGVSYTSNADFMYTGLLEKFTT